MNKLTDEVLKEKYNKLYKKFVKGDFTEVIKECNKILIKRNMKI